MRRIALCLSMLVGALCVPAPPVRADDQVARFTVVNVEYEGSKLWLPGTLVVKKGTKVTITLINNVPSGQHGFSIPAYKVAEILEKGDKKTVELTADREGIFPIICQLHPAHVGGELVVLGD